MIKFDKLADYRIPSRGTFILVRNMSTRKVETTEIQERIEIDGQTHNVLGFDFPNKIVKVHLKVGDVIGIQIKAT